MTTLAEIFPPFGLRIRGTDPETSAQLELRVLTDADLPQAALAGVEDIFPDPQVPYSFTWAHIPLPQRALNSVQFHWQRRSSVTPEEWALDFGIFLDGEFIGKQDMTATAFGTVRSAETASYLLTAYQGRGFGRLARRILCQFAFDHLGAVELTTGYHLDNAPSRAVSQRLGYLPTRMGEFPSGPDGALLPVQYASLTPQAFRAASSPLQLEVLGLTPQLLALLGVTQPNP